MRLDLPAIAAYTAGVLRARAAYRLQQRLAATERTRKTRAAYYDRTKK